MRITSTVLLLFMISIVSSFGQSERLTSEDVNIQKVFIEANKNKILGDYEGAERLFKEVIDKDKDNHAAAYELSRVYLAQDNYQKALEYANLATRINPGISWYHMLKADIHEARIELNEAAEVYETLTTQYPSERYYYEHLTDLYRKTNQLDKALLVLDRYEAKFGIIEPVMRNKFDLLDELDRSEEALEQIDKLIRIYPDHIDYLQLAASYSKQMGNDARAHDYYKRILEIDPDDSRANIALASTYRETGDDVAYLNSIQDIIRNKDINLDVKIQELIPYVQKINEKRNPELETMLIGLIESLNENHPHEAKVHAIFGDLYHATEQLSKSRSEYEKTIALDDGVFPVWEQLISIQAKQKDWAALIQTTENAMDVFPNQGQLFYYNGIAQIERKSFHDAKSILSEGLIMCGRDESLKYNILSALGLAYHELSEYDKSENALTKAIDLNPNGANALAQYAYYLASREKDLSKALSLSEKAIQNNPNLIQALHANGLVLLQQAKYTDAQSSLERAYQSGGQSQPALLEHLGDVYLALKDNTKAIEFWTLAIENGADEDSLAKKINDNKVN